MFRGQVFLLSVLLVSKAVCQRPDIVDEIHPEVKPQHGIGLLNCTVVNMETVQNSASSFVQWSKVTNTEGYPEVISQSDKVTYPDNDKNTEGTGLRKYDIRTTQLGSNRMMYTLIVRRLTENDSGEYLCTIVLEGQQWDQWPTKLGQLTVQVPPIITPLDLSDNKLTLQEGGNISIECSSSGNPSPNITWKREDGQPLPGGGFQLRASRLNFTDLQIKDRGNYICVADNNVKPPDNYVLQLKIFFKPVCFAVQNSVGQAQNRRFDAKLECIVAGYPLPSNAWMKHTSQGKIRIVDDDKYDISKQFSSKLKSDEAWYTLLVKNVQANDYTIYECIGINTYGNGSTNIQLFETMECQGANCPSIGTSGATYAMSSVLTLILTAVVAKFLHFCR